MANQYPQPQLQAPYAPSVDPASAQYNQEQANRAAYAALTAVTRVKVTDFDVPFGSLVVFLVKVAIAAIPAALILSMIFGTISFVFAAIFGASLSRLF